MQENEERPSESAAVAEVRPLDPAGEKKMVGEWAVLKKHCAETFAKQLKATKSQKFRGDRHRGPDVRVVRMHMHGKGLWRLDFKQAGDTPVTEAEYDEAVREAYAVGCTETPRSKRS
jgi:hypothetical protein